MATASSFDVFIATLCGCVIMGTCVENNLSRTDANINRLERELKPKIQEEQVIGKSTPEKFYFIDGQRAYLTIDGKPIEQYMNSSDLSTDNKNNF